MGTSGWQYRDWRSPVYPPGVPQKRWLEYYAERFATVESNNAFYRLPERDTFVEWRARTPDDFVMAVKVSRYLTHVRRLRDPGEPVRRFVSRVRGLEEKLGPVLLQLPPTLQADPGKLEATLAEFPRTMRVVVEPRHASWWTDPVRDLLTRYHAALCWADRGSRPITPLWRTAEFGYLRLHHGRARPGYGDAALTSWVRRIADTFGTSDVYVYFNNDQQAAAPADATRFAHLVSAHGLPVSRAR